MTLNDTSPIMLREIAKSDEVLSAYNKEFLSSIMVPIIDKVCVRVTAPDCTHIQSYGIEGADAACH